jgi:hypothetical protein
MEVSREHPNMIKTLLNEDKIRNNDIDNDSNNNSRSHYRNCVFVKSIDDFTGFPRFIKLKSKL